MHPIHFHITYIHRCRRIMSKILFGCRTLRNSIFWLKSDINISLNGGKALCSSLKTKWEVLRGENSFLHLSSIFFERKLKLPKVTKSYQPLGNFGVLPKVIYPTMIIIRFVKLSYGSTVYLLLSIESGFPFITIMIVMV